MNQGEEESRDLFTNPVIFNPGDGDSFYVFTKTLTVDEQRKFNAAPGDFLLFVQYAREWAILPIRNRPGHYMASSYVEEKLGDRVNLRVKSVFYAIAGYLAELKLDEYPDMGDYVDSRLMGWERDGAAEVYWRDQLLDMKNDLQNDRWSPLVKEDA